MVVILSTVSDEPGPYTAVAGTGFLVLALGSLVTLFGPRLLSVLRDPGMTKLPQIAGVSGVKSKGGSGGGFHASGSIDLGSASGVYCESCGARVGLSGLNDGSSSNAPSSPRAPASTVANTPATPGSTLPKSTPAVSIASVASADSKLSDIEEAPSRAEAGSTSAASASGAKATPRGTQLRNNKPAHSKNNSSTSSISGAGAGAGAGAGVGAGVGAQDQQRVVHDLSRKDSETDANQIAIGIATASPPNPHDSDDD